MKAVVHYELSEGCVELRDLPDPTCGQSEVVLEVKAVAVCGSDIHQRANSQSWPVNVPVVLGHEFTGIIADTGSSCEEFAVGDRVVSETAAIICGKCIECRSGQYQLCKHRKGFGYGTDGAMAKYVTVPERVLHKLPEEISFEEAALTEPCCVAFSATIMKGQPQLGDIAVVIGPGPIGMLCLKMAALSGASVCVISGLSADSKRLDLAMQLGATHKVLADQESISELVQKLSNGRGADLVIDASGASVTLKDAIDIVRPAGRIVKVGWGSQPLGYSIDPLVQKAADIRASFSHNYPMWERVIGLMKSKQLNVKPLVTQTYAIEDWAESFDAMQQRKNIKSVIVPD